MRWLFLQNFFLQLPYNILIADTAIGEIMHVTVIAFSVFAEVCIKSNILLLMLNV